MHNRSERQPQPLHLTPELVIAAYRQGLFPMARSRHDSGVEWFSPEVRAVLPLDAFRCPRSLRQVMNRNTFEIRHDTAFERVIRSCALPRPGQPQTWINTAIIHCYVTLHRQGFAHSVEAWSEGKLVGGLYGIALGGVYFGESMFHSSEPGGRDASKVCLAHLVHHLNHRGYKLLDAQINSEHMRQFGTVDIPRHEYLQRLQAALRLDVTW